MKYSTLKFTKLIVLSVSVLLFITCSKDDGNSGDTDDTTATITLNKSAIDFGEVVLNQTSAHQTFTVSAAHISGDVTFASDNDQFEISDNGEDFYLEIVLNGTSLNGQEKEIYVRFRPQNQNLGTIEAVLTVTNQDVTTQTVSLTGNSVLAPQEVTNVVTFQQSHHAFGEGLSQSQTGTFQFPDDPTQISSIKMYVQLDCPCNIWDVFANIYVKDQSSDKWLEIGRYITPYGVSTAQLERGIEIDVTDFKSLLTGSVELKSYVETWGADGWLVSIDFDVTTGGEIDYPYYAVEEVLQYNINSLEGIPYGVPNDFDVTKTVTVPVNAEETNLRTIISGWGHATPMDPGGRPCAEWCFRTHDVKINGGAMFQHDMGPLGCASNPIQPQQGNWAPDRAGWCPGVAVPNRIDTFENAMAGEAFGFEYSLEPWEADGGNTSGQPGAFYAISTFVVVKSNSPIQKPVVND